MMGWKGTMRSVIAAERRAVKAEERWQREQIRAAKREQKLLELRQARTSAQAYEAHLRAISTFHQSCSAPIDWARITQAEAPNEPANLKPFETAAAKAVEEYRPFFLIRWLGLADWFRRRLAKAIPIARKKDEDAFAHEMAQFTKAFSEWKDLHDTAQRILAKDPEAYRQVLSEKVQFEDITGIGRSVRVAFPSAREVVADLLVCEKDDIIPHDSLATLASGKLSTRKLAEGKRNEMYREYVASAVFRVAREILAAIPIETVFITARCDLLNAATGHLDQRPILSIAIPSATVHKLRFETVDPWSALQNFTHNVDFKTATGFHGVSEVRPASLRAG